MQADNPDWKSELNELVADQADKQKERYVAEKNNRDNSENLDEEPSYQLNKDEIALFTTETTNTFHNNQVKQSEESHNYKPSI